MGPPEVVRNLGDVANLNVDFNINDFSDAFFGNFENSDVSVHSLVSIVYVITRFMGDYQRDRTVGRVLTRLF
jgi:hypothetical protein